jgi:beta-phosphoglucomutase-like phosphatase (HAD superfamily)
LTWRGKTYAAGIAKPVELVIFDCDGVLVDSERIAARVQVALGEELGWRLTEAEVVVEDSQPGVRAARPAGMRAFGYAGSGSRHRLPNEQESIGAHNLCAGSSALT